MQSRLVPASPSLAMAANLNAVVHRAQSPDDALTAIMSSDVAHHVVDPDDVLDLDPLNATPLELALPQLLAAEPERWLLVLPVPGALGLLQLDPGLGVTAQPGARTVLPDRTAWMAW